MGKLTKSVKVYFILILLLTVLSALSVYLPQGNDFTSPELPAPKFVIALVNAGIMLIAYGGLGYIGLKLSRKLEYAEIWDLEVSNKERFIKPAVTGSVIGVVIITIDYIFSRFHSYDSLQHPPFPVSIIASATAGIGEEIIFRLFFISFWVWLVSHVILKGRWSDRVFWIVSVFSAIVFTLAHLPSIMFLEGLETIGEIQGPLLIELFIIDSIVSIPAAQYFRKYGILAAVGVHFWTDIVWHVLWGLS